MFDEVEAEEVIRLLIVSPVDRRSRIDQAK